MQLFEILAGVGLVAGDIFLFLSLLGALLLFIWRGLGIFTARRSRYPEVIVWWTWLGWALALLCLVSTIIVGWSRPFGQFIVELSIPNAIGLLVLIPLLVAAANLFDRMGNRRRHARRMAARKLP
jgi:hypothetical protein